ncbi:hypothetical protein [Psychroflexus aurantiacus]|nr:hypothetical protein [Psychroflexus aurantiacus]
MAKIYSNEVSEFYSKPTKPSAKTLKRILDFSKAYKLVRYKDLEFDSIQN